MDRADCLPPKMLRVPGKAIHHRRRHRNTGQDRQRAEDKHDSEIRDLLQRVVAIEAIRFRRQMKSRVVHPGVPCLQEHGRRSGHDAAATARYRRA